MSSVGGDKGETASKAEMGALLIRKAPPGQLKEVFEDVRALLKDEEALQEAARRAFLDHHMRYFLPVAVEGSEKPAHITPYNTAGEEGRFYHPRNKKTFTFDPIPSEASDWTECSSREINDLEPKRLALESAVDAYIAAHFKIGSANVYSRREMDGDKGELIVCIVSSRYQPNNFSDGHWKSQWTITLEDENSADLTGRMDVKVHYFEGGNVQMYSSRPVERKISFTNDVIFGQAVTKVISEEEAACQKSISDSCSRLDDDMFKGLRRKLPVIRSKLDWTKMISYKVGAELKPF